MSKGGIIKDPVEFAIFAYVESWGGGGDVTVLATCTHGECSATHGVGGVMLPFLQLAHGRCSATHGVWWVMLRFVQLAHMVDVPQHMGWRGDVTILATCNLLDIVWSHLKRHVPKSLCSRSKSDRRFNPRIEQYVYSYMWRYNNRNWWKQLGQLCQQHCKKENTSANEVFFFGASYFPM